jgi:hypothetical protein
MPVMNKIIVGAFISAIIISLIIVYRELTKEDVRNKKLK